MQTPRQELVEEYADQVFASLFQAFSTQKDIFNWFLEISKLMMSLAKPVKFQQNNGNQPHQTQHEDEDLRKKLPISNFEAEARL